jgi:hypothetical protein
MVEGEILQKLLKDSLVKLRLFLLQRLQIGLPFEELLLDAELVDGVDEFVQGERLNFRHGHCLYKIYKRVVVRQSQCTLTHNSSSSQNMESENYIQETSNRDEREIENNQSSV